MNKCACGCGESVKKKYVNAGHALRKEVSQRRGPRSLCACGCGKLAGPNKRYIKYHGGGGPPKGFVPWNKGKQGCWPESVKRKLHRGKDHWNYQHGRSIDRTKPNGSYSKWPKVVSIIRNRDENSCRICHKPQSDFARKLSVHHIDGNPANGEEWNLITLCNSCHVRIHRGSLELVV